MFYTKFQFILYIRLVKRISTEYYETVDNSVFVQIITYHCKASIFMRFHFSKLQERPHIKIEKSFIVNIKTAKVEHHINRVNAACVI